MAEPDFYSISKSTWLTDIPLELSAEIFKRLTPRDLANIRLVDVASLAYVNAYWEFISPLFRNRSVEYVVRIPQHTTVAFRQGQALCVGRWGLSAHLFTASLSMADIVDLGPEIGGCCGSIRTSLFQRGDEVGKMEGLYRLVGRALNQMPNLQKLSLRGDELNNTCLGMLVEEAPRLRDTLKYLEILLTPTLQLPEVEADMHWLANTELNLNHLISQICQFTLLRSLSVSGCRAEMAAVRSITTNDITNLQYLTELHLFRNSSLRCLPDAIGQLTQLEVLDLEYSSMSSLPESITSLAALRVINLGSCPLRGLPPLQSFSRLEFLGLHNALKGDLPFFHGTAHDMHDSLSNLTNLTGLRIGGNRDRIQLPSLDVLSGLVNLRELDMQRFGLSHIPEAVACLAKLTSLHLAGNNIEEIPPWIVALTNLRTLDLRLNNLTGPLPNFILAVTSLRELRLGRNRFIIRTDILRILKMRGVDLGLNS